MAGFSHEQDTWRVWMPQRCKGKLWQGSRRHQAEAPYFCNCLLEQWDHDKNRENGNLPDNTTLQSGKLIWWHCHECPKGKVHSWQAPAHNRTSGKNATGCPVCAGKKLCQCNSLETVCSDVAADFDTKKNGVSPAEVTSSTATKYSWLSGGPGAEKRSVNGRTLHTRKQLKTLIRRT